jgi:hypothetical protein
MTKGNPSPPKHIALILKSTVSQTMKTNCKQNPRRPDNAWNDKWSEVFI